jgi:hypothetical protein
MNMVQVDFKDNPAIGMPVHKDCCKRCPSNTTNPDPEVRDYMAMPKDLRMMTVFPCAWRKEKLCKGYYDLMTSGEVKGEE